MGLEDGAFRGVVYGGADFGGDVLDQRAVAPDVEGLDALADGEDGFVEVEGVLDEELVDGGAVGVWGRAVGVAGFAVFLGVDVGWAAGEENALSRREDFCDALWGLVERDGDGGRSSGVESVQVLGQGAEVVGGGVFDVAWAGGFRDRDVDRHGLPLGGL